MHAEFSRDIACPLSTPRLLQNVEHQRCSFHRASSSGSRFPAPSYSVHSLPIHLVNTGYKDKLNERVTCEDRPTTSSTAKLQCFPKTFGLIPLTRTHCELGELIKCGAPRSTDKSKAGALKGWHPVPNTRKAHQHLVGTSAVHYTNGNYISWIMNIQQIEWIVFI